jgi:hypothetical protein
MKLACLDAPVNGARACACERRRFVNREHPDRRGASLAQDNGRLSIADDHHAVCLDGDFHSFLHFSRLSLFSAACISGYNERPDTRLKTSDYTLTT